MGQNITKVGAEGFLAVQIAPDTLTIKLGSYYTDVPLDLNGSIEIGKKVVKVTLNWEFRFDYITFHVFQNAIDNTFCVEQDISRLDEHTIEVSFKRQELSELEKIASEFLDVLAEFSNRLGAIVNPQESEE